MNEVHLISIASDAAYVIDTQLDDRRRSKPFHEFAERARPDQTRLRDLLLRAEASLSGRHPIIAEQMRELLVRLEALR